MTESLAHYSLDASVCMLSLRSSAPWHSSKPLTIRPYTSFDMQQRHAKEENECSNYHHAAALHSTLRQWTPTMMRTSVRAWLSVVEQNAPLQLCAMCYDYDEGNPLLTDQLTDRQTEQLTDRSSDGQRGIPSYDSVQASRVYGRSRRDESSL